MRNNKKQVSFLSIIMIVLLGYLLFTFLVPSEQAPSFKYYEVIDMFKDGTVKKYVVDFNSGNLNMGILRTEQELKDYDKENKKEFKEKKAPKNLTEEELNDFKIREEKRKQAFEDKRTYKVYTYKLPSISLFLDDIKPIIEERNKDDSKDKILSYDYIPAVEQPWWFAMLPTVFLVGATLFLIVFMMRQTEGGGKAMSFGRLKAKQVVDDKNRVTFEDVAGADEEKEELSELVEFLKDPARFNSLGAKIPKGVLLVGPPGTGKTLLAKAVAGEAKVSYFSISGSDFVEMFVGVGAKRVRTLFSEAKAEAPSIVFIDEIDAVGRQRGAGLGGGNDEREQTLNQLLVEMDGFAPNQGVIVIAATNRRDVLDPALLRPGRFDRQVFVNRPDIKGREQILEVHTRNKPLAPDVNLKTVARGTVGFTGADLANVVNEAALLAARDNKKAIEQKNIENAIIKVIAGPEKRTRVVTEDDKKLTAYHESGHAITTYFCPKVDKVHEISIIPRGMAGGYTLSLPEKEESYKLREQLFQEVVVLLGGRAAESIILDDISTGASNDIQRVTEIAKAMVTQYGFSNSIGPIVYGSDNNQVFLGRDYGTAKDFSEATSTKIDEEVRSIVFEAYAKARSILKQHIDKLHTVSSVLMDFEKINGDVFEKLMTNDKNIFSELKQQKLEFLKDSIEETKNNDEKSLIENTVEEQKINHISQTEKDSINSLIDNTLNKTTHIDNSTSVKNNIKHDVFNEKSTEKLTEEQQEKDLNSIMDLSDDKDTKTKSILNDDNKEQIKKAIVDSIKNKYLNKNVDDSVNVVKLNEKNDIAQKTKKKEKEENKLTNSLIDIIKNNTNDDTKK